MEAETCLLLSRDQASTPLLPLLFPPSSLAHAVFPSYHLVTAMPHTTTQRPNRCDIDLLRLQLDYTPGLFKPFKHSKTNLLLFPCLINDETHRGVGIGSPGAAQWRTIIVPTGTVCPRLFFGRRPIERAAAWQRKMINFTE